MWCSCLACGDPGSAKCAGTRTASAAGIMDLSEFFFFFFEPLVAGDQKTSLSNLSPQLCLFRHIESSLAWGLFLLFGTSGT